jgi:hypothetical protein
MGKEYSVGLVADKIKDALSVADFGGDVKAALACATAYGQSLYFPEGGYTLAVDELNTVKYGHDGTFYWYKTPDGVRGRSLTRGKMLAALTAIRIHHSGIKLQLVGKLPQRKEKK